MGLAERDCLLQNWRGRRLLACRAADELEKVIAAIGDEDGTTLPPENGLPYASPGVKAELQNTVANLLRLILLMNDGHVSSHKLQRY
jgi:hypothetical protein